MDCVPSALRNIFPVMIGTNGMLVTKEYRMTAVIAPPMITTSSVRRAALLGSSSPARQRYDDVNMSTAGKDNDYPSGMAITGTINFPAAIDHPTIAARDLQKLRGPCESLASGLAAFELHIGLVDAVLEPGALT